MLLSLLELPPKLPSSEPLPLPPMTIQTMKRLLDLQRRQPCPIQNLKSRMEKVETVEMNWRINSCRKRLSLLLSLLPFLRLPRDLQGTAKENQRPFQSSMRSLPFSPNLLLPPFPPPLKHQLHLRPIRKRRNLSSQYSLPFTSTIV